MACDSKLRNGSDLNEFKIPELYVNYGGLDGCADVDELRELFDQVLSFFMKEVCVSKLVFRPFPPKLGDGQEADLFKLFLTVRRIGSYESVSENNLWEFVARECGLEVGLVASLKLIYIKYLKELDQWLSNGGFKDGKMKNIKTSVVEKLDLLSRQLGRSLVDVEIIGFEDRKRKNEGTSGLVDVKIIGFEDCKGKNKGTSGFNQVHGGMNLDFPGNNCNDEEKCSVVGHKRCELSPGYFEKVGFSMVNDEVKPKDILPDNDDDDDDDVMTTVNHDDLDNVISRSVHIQKRKREEESIQLSEMLDWLANAARDPYKNAFGTSQRSNNKGKNCMNDQLHKQALAARCALFAELKVDLGNEACGSQKKTQRMHPSMYEDDRVHLRCSRRTTAAAIPSPLKRHQTESSNTRTDRIHELTGPHDQKYNLGPRHQAEVPRWTGVVSESDPKWLGTQMWPQPNDGRNKVNEDGEMVIGQGRKGICDCVFPGSAECVRFHIAENRMRVKIELGPLFYKWKFNQMGEEISLSWEPEEERRFKSIVIKARYDLEHSSRSRREIMNKFWTKASDLIPDKLKKSIVSYYFNVFVLRRRSYQNRVTPREIDSDNDQEEVGSVGDRFGYEKIHGLSIQCSENLQRTDFES